MSDSETYPQAFADAVADVVDAARWDARIGSVRELARLSGMTHTALNKRRAKAVPYTVKDLAALAPALKVEPNEVLRRAREQVGDALLAEYAVNVRRRQRVDSQPGASDQQAEDPGR